MATIITPHGHALGWRRDLPDNRDFAFAAPTAILRDLPRKVDLRDQMPPVYDQKTVGSCTACAIGAAVQYNRRIQVAAPDFIPSRLFIYWNEREMEQTVPLDAGAEIRDGIKSVAKIGVCPEDMWPYVPTSADPITNMFPPTSAPLTKPPAQCYVEALKHCSVGYMRVQQNLNQLRGCLAQGFPFVFGFSVYSSIYDANGDPVVHLPYPSLRDQMLGGHAVTAVGYDDDTHEFVIRNSWGDQVLDHGYFYMPYSYMTDTHLSSDFWTIRHVAA